MTLIIGVKCSDGIVMGADSGATLGDITGLKTIMQPTTKLNVIAGKAIVGTSGPIGLGQLYADRVNRVHNEIRDLGSAEVCRRLRDEFRQDAEIAFRMCAMARQVLGPQAGVGAIATTLVALAAKDGAHLIQFDAECCPEIATEGLPFVSIGSGQIIADPFLAFLRRIFWKDRLPSISEGSFAVVWALNHAIKTSPGGIAEPIELAVLTVRGTQAIARKVPREEWQDHLENVTEAEKFIRSFPEQQRPSGREPEPPQVESQT